MRKIIFIFTWLLIKSAFVFANSCQDWDTLQKQIRDNAIDIKTAKKRIIELNNRLVKFADALKTNQTQFNFFPVKGYSMESIGGEKGNGFAAGGYNFYEGNKHGGHPAHDIFVNDANQDSLCDKTGKKIEIASFTDGIVIGLNKDWENSSNIRGGKYVWIFDPVLDRYYYYAHLNDIIVNVADTVTAGQLIGYLGRTGKNAVPKRSPTHLHLMCLSFDNGTMSAYNIYKELSVATKLAAETSCYPWLHSTTLTKWKINDIPGPKNYEKVEAEKDSFACWLRNLPLKPMNTPVYLYNGEKKYRQDVHYAVIDIDIGNKDLQQCADAVIRLRAEYFYAEGFYERIKFNFVNDFCADYSKWRNGYKIMAIGNQSWWVKTKRNNNYPDFRKYLDVVFNYANTFSLSKQMKPVKELKAIKAGDVFIQGGFPGHAVIVVDVAKDKDGQIIFLLAQSYMPAQDIHILKSPYPISPWYKIDFGEELQTPEWTFTKNDLRRF